MEVIGWTKRMGGYLSEAEFAQLVDRASAIGNEIVIEKSCIIYRRCKRRVDKDAKGFKFVFTKRDAYDQTRKHDGELWYFYTGLSEYEQLAQFIANDEGIVYAYYRSAGA